MSDAVIIIPTFNEEENVETTFNSNDYDSQLEGIALVVFEEHRGKGIGKLLIDAAEKLPFDFIWGMQFKSLNNLFILWFSFTFFFTISSF